MIAAAILLAVTASPSQPSDKQASDQEAALRQAMECRAYSELALNLHNDDPRMLAAHLKLQAYWVKRGNDLGKEMGLAPEVVRIRQLVIPLKAERFREVMLGCVRAAPKKAFR